MPDLRRRRVSPYIGKSEAVPFHPPPGFVSLLSPPPRARRLRIVPGLLLAMLGGCAGSGSTVTGTPVPDPGPRVTGVEASTALEGARRITFAWQITEEGIRVRGRGVRCGPPC